MFFDVLFLDSVSLLRHSYSDRRSILESIIQPVHGRALLADRSAIALTDLKNAAAELRVVFARTIADHQEGLVLKSDLGEYNDRHSPWVKVRLYYIH